MHSWHILLAYAGNKCLHTLMTQIFLLTIGPIYFLCIDKHAPITEIRVSEKCCPWIDKDRRDLMRTKDKLRKAASKTKSQFLMDSYRQVRNKVKFTNIQLKKRYFTDKITACQGNMKESWKAINEVHNKRFRSSNISCL